MKIAIFFLAALVLNNAYAFTLNEGTYISATCGKVTVGTNQNGDTFVSYEQYDSEGVDGPLWMDIGATTFTKPDFDQVTWTSGDVCRDEVTTDSEVEINAQSLTMTLGGTSSTVFQTLHLNANSKGELESIDYISKIPKVSVSCKIYVPYNMKTYASLSCNNFKRDTSAN